MNTFLIMISEMTEYRLRISPPDLVLRPDISTQVSLLAGFELAEEVIQAGEDELLLSDAQHLATHARDSSVEVKLAVWPKMWHVWHTFVPILPEAKQAIQEIGEFIRQRLGG